ncbi:hypothetical protein KCP75_19590 [Salmonella enterica subsp. enterica]|nr:hypothetical protein KCP75_19590 [Salmonella enterica subsp. enterica]
MSRRSDNFRACIRAAVDFFRWRSGSPFPIVAPPGAPVRVLRNQRCIHNAVSQRFKLANWRRHPGHAGHRWRDISAASIYSAMIGESNQYSPASVTSGYFYPITRIYSAPPAIRVVGKFIHKIRKVMPFFQ